MADTEIIGDTTAEKMSTEDIATEDITAEDIATKDITAPSEDITENETEPSKTVKEELVKEVTEELSPDSVVQETVDENGDVFEETTQVTRKVVKRTMKITETSSTTKTTTMTTPAKLYGKDLSEYDEVDVDALLAQLSPEEINILAKEVDPDDNFLPPNQRCSYECTKDPTGPLNRKKLIEHINKEALETPDLPELEPFVKGTVRGKKWVPPPRDEREIAADEQIAIDMGEEYEHALSDATQEEIIDLAAILGFHSMMNQDQYHASLLNKGQPVGLGWDGITKSTTQKLYPMDPPNNTDVEDSIKRVKDDDPKLIELNLNNIKNISDEKFEQLIDALPQNEHLEVLSLTNVGLTDKTALLLAEAIEKSKTLRVLNVETNFINPPVVVTLVKALLKARTIEEFRASNQRSTVLGNKIEMEITDLVEKNTSLLRLGLHLEFNDARHRVAAHLQRNIDRNEHEFRKGNSSSPIPNATSITAGTVDDLSSLLSSQKRTTKANSPKPKHIVLTPQERIDSKSELIASLVSQKLSDRDRGEISLPVPQLVSGSKSTSKEAKFPVSARDNASSKEIKSSINIKDLLPKLSEESRNDEKQALPTRHPKIGELRDSSISRAVDKESISIQENGQTPESVEQINQPPKEAKSLGVNTDSEAKTPIDDSSIAPIPKKSEDKSAVETLSKQQISVDVVQTRVEVSSEKSVVEISYSVEETESVRVPKTLDQTRQREIAQKEQTLTERSSGDRSQNRERLSESVSPSRHLESNLALLQAKIDSFAEVADEKLSSLRSKFDDIARDTTTDQPIDSSEIPSENGKPRPSIASVTTVDFVKPTDADSQSTNPISLPPKPPQKRLSNPKVVPIRSLVSTPNSIGISFLYQKQLFPKIEIQATPVVDQSTVATAEKLNSVDLSIDIAQKQKENPVISPENISEETAQSLQSEIEKTSKENAKILSQDAENVTELPNSRAANPISEQIKPNADESNDHTTDLIKPINEPKAQLPDNPTTQSIENPKSGDETSKNAKIDAQLKKVDKTTAFSFLRIKKRDPLQIEPIKTIEAATQSPAQPSGLSRLSVKKGDPQIIDPTKKTEVGTQSLAKRNPLSLLSVKKCDLVDINPVARLEVASQASLQNPTTEVSCQTIDDDPTPTIEESTQTPLIFSSLEHDHVFPGLRNVPNLPRPKTINIGGGDRVVIKPSTKPINEILMLLYPIVHDYSNATKHEKTSAKEADLKSVSTIQDLEEEIQKATEVSDSIWKVVPQPPEDPIKPEEEATSSIEPEKDAPLVEKTDPISMESSVEDRASISTAARYETKFTTIEKVSALSSTTIASEAHVKVVDRAYNSVATVSSEEEHASKTSIRSANMWESLSSNLIKASEQTLIDIAKSTNTSETVSSKRIGKVSVYSSIENLSDSARFKYTDRQIGGLIKTVEKTSVYSSSEDLPLTYTRYSDRYSDDRVKAMSKASLNSSSEDLVQSSRTKYSDRFASDLAKSMGKASVYSSTEDLSETSYTKYSNRYSDSKSLTKTSNSSMDTSSRSHFKSKEDISLLPRSKFSDRYKEDHISGGSLETHRSHPKFQVSQELSHISKNLDRSYYKSAVLDSHLRSRTQYKSSEDLSYRSKIVDRSTHELGKSHDSSLQVAIQSAISRNQSALRPYTYVPSSALTDLAIDHVRTRPSSPSGIHTSTLQLNVSPSGINELPSRYSYLGKDTIDKPKIVITRTRDENKSIRAISPIDRSHPSSNLLTPHRRVSDHTSDDLIEESSQSTLDTSYASAAITAELNASTTTTSTTTPKKRANIMDTIKMLKNRVRDVITTEDRVSETHRLSSSSSIVSSSQSSSTRTSARTTSSSLNIPHNNDEKEI